MKQRDDVIAVTGEVLAEHRGGLYIVRADAPLSREVLCHLCGTMRRARIRVLPGDRVELEVSIYSPKLDRGRIMFRGERRASA